MIDGLVDSQFFLLRVLKVIFNTLNYMGKNSAKFFFP